MGHGGQSPPLLGWTQMINAIFLSPCNRYWYVTAYKVDKAIILKGPWPFAHTFVMETKEHLVILLLLLVTYLPIAASNNLAASKDARKLMLWVTGLIALLALAMDAEGAIIAMGVKVALLTK